MAGLRKFWLGDPAPQRGQILISNTDDTDLVLRMEPWADETVIPPGGSARVMYVGPEPADMHVQVADRVLVIHGWVGSILDVEDLASDTVR